MAPLERTIATLLLATLPLPAAATTRTVDLVVDENDSGCVPGDCSLREALADAVDGDDVVFALPGSPPWTIRVLGGAGLGTLTIDSDVTIAGPGADELAISGDSNADGTGDRRVLDVAATAAPQISGITIRDGRLTSSADRHGGCVIVRGDATFDAVRFEGCRAWSGGTLGVGINGGDGGAIYVAAGASLLIEDSTLAGNFGGDGEGNFQVPFGAGGRGGAIASAGSGATIRRSTFVGNRGGTGGQSFGTGGAGGALAALAGTTLVEESTFSGNASGDGGSFQASHGPDGPGGAIYVLADTTLNDVTLSGNTIGSTSVGTSATGGGVHVASGIARLRNVTVTANASNGAGGGIARSSGTLELANSIVAANASSGTSNEDCSGTLSSLGSNVVGVNNGCAASLIPTDQSGTAASPLDAALEPLAANGGPTETHALAGGSPALDGGNAGGCLGWDPTLGVDFPFTTDQRGEPRPTDGDGDSTLVCDAGSFEAPTFVAPTWQLTVALGGAGSGDVSSSPAGIACPTDCDEPFADGTEVTLTAAADGGSIFTGWSGDCSGTGSCQLTMSADRDVTATFVTLRSLTVSVVGSGAVTSSPAGIDCPGDCGEDYPDGEVVDLTATPSPGFELASWSGDCTGAGACQVTMTQNRAVTATFQPVAVLRSLAVAVAGPGSVTSTPPGITCPGDCSEDYEEGAVVSLAATPGPDAHLVSWSGDCAGTGACEVTMSVDRTVAATFDTMPFLDGFESGDTGAWSVSSP